MNTTSRPPLAELVEEHIPYEIWMLHQTHDLIGIGPGVFGQILRNALIESYAVHARNLIEFFKLKNKSYLVEATIFAPNFAPAEFPDAWEHMIARQIAHLHLQRPPGEQGKIDQPDRTKMLERLNKEAARFVEHLSDIYASYWDPKGVTGLRPVKSGSPPAPPLI